MQFTTMLGIGVVVGLLIGLTGMGSGSLLTPLLILFGGMTAPVAVGTSLAFSFLTKLYGSWSFYQRGFVQMNIVRDLGLGGLPGVLFGAFVIRYLGIRRPDVMNAFLLRAIGLVLIIVSLIMLLRLLPFAFRPAVLAGRLPSSNRYGRILIILVGFGVGASVTVTSIGSGAALIPAMVLFYRLDSGTLVGTNIFVGAMMGAIALLPHAGLGHISWSTVVALLCGSLPALWLSSQIHSGVPRHITEGIIACALMAMGVHIMWF